VSLASIGPITTDTAAKLGLTMDITAKEYTILGLIAAMTEARSSEGK